MRLLDLYCGAGGASMGYHQAGFEVIGVDIKYHPNYPFTFIQADACNMLDTLLMGGTTHDARIDYRVGWVYNLRNFDAIHASPPCQGYTALKYRQDDTGKYPLLIEPTRERLQQTGLPYVIENVPGAPLREPVTLCGSQFGLTTEWPGYGEVGLRRHRLFETDFYLPDAGAHDHSLLSVPVFGRGPSGRKMTLKGPGLAKAAREVMEIGWMTYRELCQAIPPAYTRYIGTCLMQYLEMRTAA
jgi:DNA (cytosine-5)-methyltransferase 1